MLTREQIDELVDRCYEDASNDVHDLRHIADSDCPASEEQEIEQGNKAVSYYFLLDSNLIFHHYPPSSLAAWLYCSNDCKITAKNRQWFKTTPLKITWPTLRKKIDVPANILEQLNKLAKINNDFVIIAIFLWYNMITLPKTKKTSANTKRRRQ